ncbi:MAG: hypothetical protein IJ621_04335 [Paludibacteraceae bacterium]|nr:hypothetical protein [Paludibacteraceae bacterium]
MIETTDGATMWESELPYMWEGLSQTVAFDTLHRQSTQGKWSTLCLPFNVNKSQTIVLGLNGRVYAFRQADLWAMQHKSILLPHSPSRREKAIS